MRIVDLSMCIEEGMQTFDAPWHPFVEISQLGRHGIENRETRKLILGTHSGTHIDAPLHFIPQGGTVEQIPLEHLVGKATVADFSDLPEKHEITAAQLAACIGERTREKVIFRYDWDAMLGTNKYYTHHPFLSEDACEWLVEEGCQVICMDTPQPDNPLNGRFAEKDAPNHKILLSKNVIIAEYLINIKQLIKQEVFLVVAPLKIKGADGAPARCFAIEEEGIK